MRVLVIGYGNPLRSDDGLGWRVAEELQARLQMQIEGHTAASAAGLEIITCQQLNPELAEPISRADLTVFIDAAGAEAFQAGPPGAEQVVTKPHEPGAILEFELEPTCQSPQCFSHELTPSTLLACAGELFGSCSKGKLFSIVGADFGMGESLSAPVAAAVPEVIGRIEALFASETQRDKTQTAQLPQ